MSYGLIDGKIVLETFEKSQKAVNLKRDPRLACLLESGTEYNQLKGIQINGTAKLVTDKAEILEVMKAVLGRNHEMDEKTLEMAAVLRRRDVVVTTFMLTADPTLVDFVEGNLSQKGAARCELGFLKPVMRRAFLERHGLRYDPQLRLGEDYDLYTRCLMKGARFALSHRVGYRAEVRERRGRTRSFG